MTYTSKNGILCDMRKIHDEIKRHPFRITLNADDIATYKELLYELTNVWCDLTYHCIGISTDEQKLLHQFCYWIHDYRAILKSWDTTSFPIEYFDYFEQMLQITHIYLDTGSLEYFYNPDWITVKEYGCSVRKRKITKYELITKEKCGIDSAELPQYFPVEAKLCINDELVKKWFQNNLPYSNKTENERQAAFDYWLKNTKPVLEWVNGRVKDNNLNSDIWKSTVLKNYKT